ncbi:MAG: hypothetical protein KGJ49_05040 [Alphaproteobacteria bacterium]|nr:hypothetical protein [Alphaproteobacteria bacterium]
MRLTIALLFAALSATAALAAMSDAEIKQAVIQESIASYPGACACPYNVARNGSRCGRRSAYSRPGGYAPICYEVQVKREMIRAYCQQHGQ